MSSLAACNGYEPPRKKFQPSSSSLSSPQLFSSLPLDIVLDILARVPKRYYPIISCVCKNLRSLVNSPDLCKMRSLLGKESLYVCFMDEMYSPIEEYWYTLRRIENSMTENLFEPLDFSYLPEPCDLSHMLVVSSEIFFIPGSYSPSSSLWILDTRTGELRQGPSMLVERRSNSIGLVGGKIYVIGGSRDDEIPAECFDLKTHTWEAAPIPDETESHLWNLAVNVSFDSKVCALTYHLGMTMMISYDTRHGSCERSELPDGKWWGSGVCVIDNLLYVYFSRFGLMWYDSELMLWRVVYGLDLGKPQSVGMAEYYGKLAFLWQKPSLVSSGSQEIWCRMIGLVRSEVGIHATAETSQLLQTVPDGEFYELCHCCSVSC